MNNAPVHRLHRTLGLVRAQVILRPLVLASLLSLVSCSSSPTPTSVPTPVPTPAPIQNDCLPGTACSRFSPETMDRFVRNCADRSANTLTACLQRESGDGNTASFLIPSNDPLGHWQCTEFAWFAYERVFSLGGSGLGSRQQRLIDVQDNASLVGSLIATYDDLGVYDGPGNHIAVIKQVHRDVNNRINRVDVWDANWGYKGMLHIHSIAVAPGAERPNNLANYFLINNYLSE